MGVLNVTPDSFYDGGRFFDPVRAAAQGLRLAEEGADIIDVGGESTGPKSSAVSLKEEISRVIPLIEKLRAKTKVWISVDTYKAETARLALEAGADMVNDVTALRGDRKMADTLAGYDVPVVIMYGKDKTPRTTIKNKSYKNVIKTVLDFLRGRVEYGVKKGIKHSRFIIDPGMGAFISSDPKYSLQILKNLALLGKIGLPILVGASRKSFIGAALNLPVEERLEGSLACAAVAVMNGAAIIRAHDVKETRRVVDMVRIIQNS